MRLSYIEEGNEVSVQSTLDDEEYIDKSRDFSSNVHSTTAPEVSDEVLSVGDSEQTERYEHLYDQLVELVRDWGQWYAHVNSYERRPLAFECPYCDVSEGERCVTESGNEKPPRQCHKDRRSKERNERNQRFHAFQNEYLEVVDELESLCEEMYEAWVLEYQEEIVNDLSPRRRGGHIPQDGR